VLSFVAVAPGGTQVLAHSINVNDVPLLPDFLFIQNGVFSFVAATTTSITVQNNSLVAANCSVWLFRLHTFDRDFGADTTINLAPQPFVVVGSTNVGSAGAADQNFRYTATGAEGSDFNITLPAARATDIYVVEMTQAGVTAIVGIDAPDVLAGDRTATQFRVVTTGALTAGDLFDIMVANRT
jgi:hypothetical protein